MAQTICAATDTPCLIAEIENSAKSISEPRWRNYAYRDLAVSKAVEGHYDDATAMVQLIDNPDTQAMTIRAIGMALAIHRKLSDDEYKTLFAKLDKAAQTITDAGAKDIAYTYIAMAQAFAGLDADATHTTMRMTNPALKYKAYAETAEIQAERGDYNAAIQSINAIESAAFKNKALSTVTTLFIKQQDYNSAVKTASAITNPTTKASALQSIVNARQGLDKAE